MKTTLTGSIKYFLYILTKSIFCLTNHMTHDHLSRNIISSIFFYGLEINDLLRTTKDNFWLFLRQMHP
jgi:hypothetical protein